MEAKLKALQEKIKADKKAALEKAKLERLQAAEKVSVSAVADQAAKERFALEFAARERGHDSHEEMIRTGDTGGGQMAVDSGSDDEAAGTAAEILRLEDVQKKDRQIAQQQVKLAGGGAARKFRRL